MLANLSLLMATVCDMVKLKLGIATTMLQQHFQHLMTPLCTNSRLKLLRILFFSKVAVYSLLHNKYTSLPLLKKKKSTPNIVGYLQHYYSCPTNLTFFTRSFYLLKIRKAPLFQSSPVSPQACSQASLTIIYFQRGTRSKGKKKSDTNQVTASNRSKESGMESLKQAWLRDQA